jgi:hypothetical protein
VPALAGRDRREPSEAVARGEVRVRRKQRLEHRDAAGHAGDQPRRVVTVVERVRVGAHGHQQPCHRHVVVRRREQQRRAPPLVTRLDVGACSERHGDSIGVAGRGRSDQRSVRTGGSVRGGQGREDVLEVVVPASGGHLHRRETCGRGTVGQPHATGGQDPHGGRVGSGVLTQPDRLVYRLVADPVHMVAIDAGPKQLADDERVASLGCTDEAGSVPAVLVVDPRAVAQRETQEGEVALARGDQVGGLLGRVLGVDVGAAQDQPAGPGHVVGPGCGQQLLVEVRLRVECRRAVRARRGRRRPGRAGRPALRVRGRRFEGSRAAVVTPARHDREEENGDAEHPSVTAAAHRVGSVTTW